MKQTNTRKSNKANKANKSTNTKFSTKKRSWDQVKLMKRVDGYFENVCSKSKIKAMISVLKSHTLRKFKNQLKSESEPLFMHFHQLYGKHFDPFKLGDKFEYTFKTNDKLTTSLSQMMFFKWCLTYDILSKYYDFF